MRLYAVTLMGLFAHLSTGLLSAGSPPTILVPPGDQTVLEGTTLKLSVTAGGTNLTYQWSHNNQILGSATNAIFFVRQTRVAHAGPYTVRVCSGLDCVESQPARVEITPAAEPTELEWTRQPVKHFSSQPLSTDMEQYLSFHLAPFAGMVTAPNGELIVAGVVPTGGTSLTATFEGQTFSGASLSWYYLARYAPSGTPLQIYLNAEPLIPEAPVTDHSLASVGVDGLGNAYLSGSSRHSGTYTTTRNFFYKFSPTGLQLWSKPGVNADLLTGDPSGNCYAVVWSGSTSWLTRFDKDGNSTNLVILGGADNLSVSGLAGDSQGAVYLLCSFVGTLNRWGLSLPSRGQTDLVLARLNAGGDAVWVRQLGGSGQDYPVWQGLCASPSGRLGLSLTSYSRDFRMGDQLVTWDGQSAVVVAQMDPGGSLIWTANIVTDASTNLLPTSCGTDNAGRFYAGMRFEGKLKAGSHTITSAGEREIVALAYTPEGQLAWARQAGEKPGYYAIYSGALASDPFGAVYLGNPFRGDLTIGDRTLLPFTGFSPQFFWLAKFTPAAHLSLLSATEGASGTSVSLQLSSQYVWPHAIEASTNFTTWSPVAKATNTTGTTTVEFLAPPGQPQGFYRARPTYF